MVREYRPKLLTNAERQLMLAEIATVALTVGRDLYPDVALNDLDIGTGSTIEICPRERLAFIASAWKRLVRALGRLEAEPPSALVLATQEVPVERARRITAKDLLFALRKGDFIEAEPNLSLLASQFGDKLPRRVPERVCLPTADTPANRMVKTVLATFVRDLTGIAELATVADAHGVAKEAFRLRRAIRTTLYCLPWQTLPPAIVPTLPPTLRTHGAYRLFWDTWRQYKSGFAFDWRNPLFSLSSREDWLLYEYWCLFQVVKGLSGLGFRAESADGFLLSRSGLSFRLVKGRASTLHFRHTATGNRVTVTYNPEYPTLPKQTGFHSLSHTMRPDIVVASSNRLLIFDAKFKGYATAALLAETDTLPLTADINQMHAYRDGIRDPSGNRPVQGAWLLYVGEPTGNNQPIVAYPASTVEVPFGRGELGALRLRPGEQAEPLKRLIATVLQRVGGDENL